MVAPSISEGGFTVLVELPRVENVLQRKSNQALLTQGNSFGSVSARRDRGFLLSDVSISPSFRQEKPPELTVLICLSNFVR